MVGRRSLETTPTEIPSIDTKIYEYAETISKDLIGEALTSNRFFATSPIDVIAYENNTISGRAEELSDTSPVVAALLREFKENVLPERVVYKPLEQRKLSAADKMEIGEAVGKLLECGGNRISLSGPKLTDICLPIIRKAFTKYDNSENIQKNKELRESVNKRLKAYVEEVQRVVMGIASGVDKNPVESFRRLKETNKWL